MKLEDVFYDGFMTGYIGDLDSGFGCGCLSIILVISLLITVVYFLGAR